MSRIYTDGRVRIWKPCRRRLGYGRQAGKRTLRETREQDRVDFRSAVPLSQINLLAPHPYYYPAELSFLNTFWVPRRFQWYIAEGMLSLPTAKWSMVISFFNGVIPVSEPQKWDMVDLTEEGKPS